MLGGPLAQIIVGAEKYQLAHVRIRQLDAGYFGHTDEAIAAADAAGVTAYLEKKDSGTGGAAARILNVATGAGGVALTTGALVLRSHELLAAVTASETSSRTRVISAPSIIATDSIPASLNVGEDVPVLTSQAVGGVQQSGSSLFTNTVSQQSTGVTLNITARVNSSGIVTMIINQNVRAR